MTQVTRFYETFLVRGIYNEILHKLFAFILANKVAKKLSQETAFEVSKNRQLFARISIALNQY